MNALKKILLSLVCTLVWVSPAAGQNVVYETGFEEFNGGIGGWVSNKWIGNDLGCVGIDNNLVPGLGKTGYIGFNEPQTTKVVMMRPLPIATQEEGIDEISFRTLMGIQDSSNQRRDAFCFTVYNQIGKVLACLRFDNRNAHYGIWRFDGTDMENTGTAFLRGQLYDLRFNISYTNNTWSALLDGLPLFTDKPFHTAGETLDFRGVAAEWIITGGSPQQYGNNWLLVADWKVTTSSPLKDELVYVPLSPHGLVISQSVSSSSSGVNADVFASASASASASGASASASANANASASGASASASVNVNAIQSPRLRWAARTNGRYYIETTQDLRSLQPWTVSGDSGWVQAGHQFELELDLPDEDQRFFRIRRSTEKEVAP